MSHLLAPMSHFRTNRDLPEVLMFASNHSLGNNVWIETAPKD